jgi:Na+-transporting NADH:ubiquinone oxidoreductase subunit NqrD
MAEHTHPEKAPLGAISFGLAVGLTWAFVVFFIGICSALLGWGTLISQMLASLYVGFGPTVVGCIAGAVWAFATAFVVGWIVAALYNLFLHRRR